MDRGKLTVFVLGDPAFTTRIARQFRQFATVVAVDSLRALADVAPTADWAVAVTNLASTTEACDTNLPLIFYLGSGSRPAWLPPTSVALLEPTPTFTVINYALHQRDRWQRQQAWRATNTASGVKPGGQGSRLRRA